MTHYCTYFDSGFLIQGLALWRSLQRVDPEACLWVLALDSDAASALRRIGDTAMRVVELGEIELTDSGLAGCRAGRSKVEYYFTLSPCWPRWLLQSHAEIGRVTLLDADMLFFTSLRPELDAMDQNGASVLVTEHRFPSWLSHYEKHGRFNVGVLSFRRDTAGMGCLDSWRAECLEWCFDRLEGGRYADQKYLDAWPKRLGKALYICGHAGVNLAPWNWCRHRLGEAVGGPTVDGSPLVIFHFARFRPCADQRWFESGQLDYGVMTQAWRRVVYGAYWRALSESAAEWRNLGVPAAYRRRPLRVDRRYWRQLPLRLIFGGRWLRIGDRFWNLRGGLGRWSGHCLALARRMRFRT